MKSGFRVTVRIVYLFLTESLLMIYLNYNLYYLSYDHVCCCDGKLTNASTNAYSRMTT